MQDYECVLALLTGQNHQPCVKTIYWHGTNIWKTLSLYMLLPQESCDEELRSIMAETIRGRQRRILERENNNK